MTKNGHPVGGFPGLGDDVKGAAGGINHRGARDADFWSHLRANDIQEPYGSHARGWIDEADLPQRGGVRARIVVRVESIDGVMRGGYIDDITGSFAGNTNL